MKSERSQEKVVPLTWLSWDIVEENASQFYDVIFTEDFGDIQAGSHFDVVYVDFGGGILETYINNESEDPNADFIPQTVLNTIYFKATPIDTQE